MEPGWETERCVEGEENCSLSGGQLKGRDGRYWNEEMGGLDFLCNGRIWLVLRKGIGESSGLLREEFELCCMWMGVRGAISWKDLKWLQLWTPSSSSKLSVSICESSSKLRKESCQNMQWTTSWKYISIPHQGNLVTIHQYRDIDFYWAVGICSAHCLTALL